MGGGGKSEADLKTRDPFKKGVEALHRGSGYIFKVKGLGFFGCEILGYLLHSFRF